MVLFPVGTMKQLISILVYTSKITREREWQDAKLESPVNSVVVECIPQCAKRGLASTPVQVKKIDGLTWPFPLLFVAGASWQVLLLAVWYPFLSRRESFQSVGHSPVPRLPQSLHRRSRRRS